MEYNPDIDESPAIPEVLDSIDGFEISSVAPNTYDHRFSRIAYMLAQLGADEEQMATALCVSPDLLRSWRTSHPEFDFAIRRGGILADAKVANALYRRATGYTYTKTIYATFQGSIMDSREVAEHVAPDVKAAIFWLKNRAQLKWKEDRAPDTPSHPLEALSDTELREVLRRGGLVTQTSPIDMLEVLPDGVDQQPPDPQLTANPLPQHLPTVPVNIHRPDDPPMEELTK